MLLRGTYAAPAPLSSGFRGGCPGAEGATRPLCETYAAAEPGRGRRGAGRNCGARTCVTLRATTLRASCCGGAMSDGLPFCAWRDGWGCLAAGYRFRRCTCPPVSWPPKLSHEGIRDDADRSRARGNDRTRAGGRGAHDAAAFQPRRGRTDSDDAGVREDADEHEEGLRHCSENAEVEPRPGPPCVLSTWRPHLCAPSLSPPLL